MSLPFTPLPPSTQFPYHHGPSLNTLVLHHPIVCVNGQWIYVPKYFGNCFILPLINQNSTLELSMIIAQILCLHLMDYQFILPSTFTPIFSFLSLLNPITPLNIYAILLYRGSFINSLMNLPNT